MRTSPADPTAMDELPIGRLQPITVQRLTSAPMVHHRAGPWTACGEDFSRLLRVGTAKPLPAGKPLAAPRSLERPAQAAVA